MVRIAITGGIACGKSLVASYVAELGIPVCEADVLAHAILAPGEAVYRAVVERFGGDIVEPGGAIDRSRLGRLVFEDEQRLADLNALTHPEIMRRLRVWLAQRGPAETAAAAVIPLLYEIGDEVNWDRVVCVAAPEAEQLRRLADRGLIGDEARRRLASQWPQVRKTERADFVIYNGGSRELLRQQTIEVMRIIGEHDHGRT